MGDILSHYWLAGLFVLLAGVLVVLGLAFFRRHAGWGLSLIGWGVCLGLLGLGGLVPVSNVTWAYWVLGIGGLLLCSLILALLLTGAWWAPLAYVATALILFGLGGLCLKPIGENLTGAGTSLLTLEFLRPWWLLLLLLTPVIVVLCYPRLNRQEPRPWVSMALRCALVIFMALALAEPQLRQQTRNVTVLFLYDRSQSIPAELAPDPDDPNKQIDLREQRIIDFINSSVRDHQRNQTQDQAGVIAFARKPRLELPPSDAPRLNFKKDLLGGLNDTRTDLAGAIKLALASFPEGTGKRIVLISDGNENVGDALEQARLAQTLGVQIDVVPLGAGQRNEGEVLVERVDVPPVIEQGAKLPITVLVRSHNPNLVVGQLTLEQVSVNPDTGEAKKITIGEPRQVVLKRGLNPFRFARPLTSKQGSYSYEARFEPLWVQDRKGNKLPKGELAGDRVQNNRASAHVVARGQKRILVLTGKKDTHKELTEVLEKAGDKKFTVLVRPITFLDNFKDPAQLAVLLSNFDCLVLADVAADQVSTTQQKTIRSNTHEQGCGLVMIGGRDSFGAGGWQKTPVEEALPVDCEIKSLKVQGKGGLVMIMHASEMARGNRWQKVIAKLAVERLGPADEVGILDWRFRTRWFLPMQPIAGNKRKILQQINKLQPGDMPNFDPPLDMAYKTLMAKKDTLATKHIIIISDGDPRMTTNLKKFADNKITITTVGVATHGANEDKKMAQIAKATGGRYYGPRTKPINTRDPKNLPAIYIKESRLVSQSFVYDKPFPPVLVFKAGPTARLAAPLPALGGFVRTTPKNSPLVQMPIVTPRINEQTFPILAHWHYGLGKSVAFTSSAGHTTDRQGKDEFWSKEWLAGGGQQGIFSQFWDQVIEWSLRPTESGRLVMTARQRDGKIRIRVEARTEDGKPDINLELRGGITTPVRQGEDDNISSLRFTQVKSGVYEAEVKAEESGSYFVAAQAKRKRMVKGPDGKEREVEELDSVRAGVTVPFSPEFSEMETNTTLLENIRRLTDGKIYLDSQDDLQEAVNSGSVFRPAPARIMSWQPLWYWLLMLTALLLVVDVAVRRLAVDTEQIATTSARAWARLRGLPIPEGIQEPATERLQARQSTAGTVADPERARRRFAGATTSTGVPPGTDTSGPELPHRPPTQPATDRPGLEPSTPPAQPAAEEGDHLSRLLRAKKRAMGDKKDQEER